VGAASEAIEDGGTGDGAGGGIGRSSALLLLAQLSSNLGFFIAVLVLARALSPAGRGTVAFVTVGAAVLARVTQLGVDQATTILSAQRPSERPALLTNLLLFSVVSSAAVGGIVFAALWVLGVHPVGLSHGLLAILVLGAMASALVDDGLAFLLGLGRPGDWTRIASIAPWLYALALGALWGAGRLHVLQAAVAWMLAHFVWAGAAAVSCRARTPFGRPRLDLLREAIVLGIRTWGGSLSRFLNFRLDQIILGSLATAGALGIYSVAVNVSEVTLYLPGAVAAAVTPAIARAMPERRVEQALKTFRALTAITIMTIAVAALAGAFLLPIVFGDTYRGSVVPYLCLLPGAVGYAAISVFSSALMSSPKPLLSSLGPVVALVVGVALDFALIPPFGATGAGVAASAAFIAGGVASELAYRSVAGFSRAQLVPRASDVREFLLMARSLVRRYAHRTGVTESPVEPN
jgi:O-antigen/teichoic acid export membrane protein